MESILLQYSVSIHDLEEYFNPFSNDNLFELLLENGIEGPLFPKSKDFYYLDIPVSDLSQDTFILKSCDTIQISIIFEKFLDEIFIEYLNDTSPDMLGFLTTDGVNMYNQFTQDVFQLTWIKKRTIKSPSLFDLPKINNDYFLYGFAVRDIKPNEIKEVRINYINHERNIETLKIFKT